METDELQNAFSTHIKRKSITMQEVREIMDSTPMLESVSPVKSLIFDLSPRILFIMPWKFHVLRDRLLVILWRK